MTKFYLFNHSDGGSYEPTDVFVVGAESEQQAIKKAADYCGFPHEFNLDESLTVKLLDPNAPLERDGIYSFIHEEETNHSVLGREVKPEEIPVEQS